MRFEVRDMGVPFGLEEQTPSDRYIGLYDNETPLSEGSNPRYWGCVLPNGEGFVYRIAENDSFCMVQDFDPALSGNIPMNEGRCTALVIEYLTLWASQIERGERE